MTELTYAAKQRQYFIDQMLILYGRIGRKEIMSFFAVGPATASRDIKLYLEMFPKNLVFNPNQKNYLRTYEFKKGY